MSLQYAILGFLSYQSLTGYDLKKAFDKSVQHFWPADQAQIYRTLNKIVAQELAELEVQFQDGKPNKKVYHITEAGHTKLAEWLKAPQSPPAYRDPFLIQLYFAGHLTDDEATQLLAQAIQDAEAALVTYRAVWQYWVTNQPSREQFFAFLTLEQAVALQQTNLAWLKTVQIRLAEGNYTVNLGDF